MVLICTLRCVNKVQNCNVFTGTVPVTALLNGYTKKRVLFIGINGSTEDL